MTEEHRRDWIYERVADLGSVDYVRRRLRTVVALGPSGRDRRAWDREVIHRLRMPCRRAGTAVDFVARRFAHRRKTLANSVELSDVSSREEAVRALDAIGRAPATRAEELAPHEFVALARALP